MMYKTVKMFYYFSLVLGSYLTNYKKNAQIKTCQIEIALINITFIN